MDRSVTKRKVLAFSLVAAGIMGCDGAETDDLITGPPNSDSEGLSSISGALRVADR